MNTSDCCWCCREICIIGEFLCHFFFLFAFIGVPTALNVMFLRVFPFQASGALRNLSKWWPDQVTDNQVGMSEPKAVPETQEFYHAAVSELSIQGSYVNHVLLWNTSCSRFGSQQKSETKAASLQVA